MGQLQFSFVTPEQSAPERNQLQPASYLRRSFVLEGAIRKATLYSTALGVYIPYINGREVENARLMPGFTNYHKRVQYFTTDVTDALREGENVLAAILGDGWYRGSLGAFSQRAFYGDRIQFAAILEVETEKGLIRIETDESVKATRDGPIRGNDIKTFEIVDMTREMPGWNQPGFDDSAWHPCVKCRYDGDTVPFEGERVTEHERFHPTPLITPNGDRVLDFGQNLAGHVEFTVTGAAGVKVTLEMGETLDEDGNFTVRNLSEMTVPDIREGMEIPRNLLGQTLAYTLKEGTQTYKSAFLTSGFRYVRLTNWPEEVKAENFSAVAVYADIPYTGDFRCSNDEINRLVSNVRWSMKSNFIDVPTDCPTRERAGWTGDVNVFAETACYLADTGKFLKKWLNDFLSLQKANGSLPFIVPEVPLETEGADMMNTPYSSAGWSDALIQVPMILYQFYGDTEILETVYESAKRYVDFNTERAKQKHKLHFYKIAGHYAYILDTGYHWGEWLEPGSSMAKDAMQAFMFPDAEVATAWFYHSADLLSQMAGILHRDEDERKYKTLASKIKAAYRKEFLRYGTVCSKRQCRYVRPVSMGLANEKAAKKIVKRLNKLCQKNKYRIGTGFLTTYQVLQVLSDYGYAETAYRMLTQKQCPGWMYEIENGATTVWENWMGIDENGAPKDSQNHYAPGAALAWLFSHVGGLRPSKPGFSEVRIAPTPVGDLTWAETECHSRRGTISLRWERNGNRFQLSVTLPAGVAGLVKMPDGSEHAVSGHAQLECLYEAKTQN
ncbi:MAG: family 78 glycoside hydrolase catalytic domain [Oscillibacter sp.]|nr:family 78 glycoside hydrolase catalytic domain [Oscillibacter sp.]